MKLFISWSKESSHSVALVLRDWLPMVVPSATPWVSSEDISKGSRGRDVIVKELAGTGQGVICLTRQNVKEPWLNFEAGALSNHSSDARVRTVLFDLKPSDVVGPLSDFQHTDLNSQEDVLKLVRSINDGCEHKLNERHLTAYCDRFWADLVSALAIVRERQPALQVDSDGVTARDPGQVLEEVLERVRAIERQQRTLASGLTLLHEKRHERPLEGLVEHFTPSMHLGFVIDESLGVGEIVERDHEGANIRFISGTHRLPADVVRRTPIYEQREEAQFVYRQRVNRDRTSIADPVDRRAGPVEGSFPDSDREPPA